MAEFEMTPAVAWLEADFERKLINPTSDERYGRTYQRNGFFNYRDDSDEVYGPYWEQHDAMVVEFNNEEDYEEQEHFYDRFGRAG